MLLQADRAVHRLRQDGCALRHPAACSAGVRVLLEQPRRFLRELRRGDNPGPHRRGDAFPLRGLLSAQAAALRKLLADRADDQGDRPRWRTGPVRLLLARSPGDLRRLRP